MIDQVSRELGPIDVLVNNAGLSVWQYMVNVDQESWDKMIDINIRGSLNCIAAVLPGMVERKKGYIINMSSIRGVTTGTGGGRLLWHQALLGRSQWWPEGRGRCPMTNFLHM